MLIRFVIDDLDAQSGRRQGLFQAGEDLQLSGRMSPEDLASMEAIYQWFKANLPVPSRFSVSKRPHAKAQALSWFRDSAREHIARMRDYRRLLEAHGCAVWVLRTQRPGYVVYEDDLQVVAYPFADTPC